jgi:hypothetical protein
MLKMFLEWSITAFVGMGTSMLLHLLISRSKLVPTAGPVDVRRPRSRLLRTLTRLAGGMTFLTLTVLTVTGWSGAWPARHLTGYALMVHVAAGAVFALVLAVWAVLSAGRYFRAGDPASGAAGRLRQFCFWSMTVLSLPLILSIALNLFPLFAQSAQAGLAQCHRYSALGFVLAAWGYAYRRWREGWSHGVSMKDT